MPLTRCVVASFKIMKPVASVATVRLPTNTEEIQRHAMVWGTTLEIGTPDVLSSSTGSDTTVARQSG